MNKRLELWELFTIIFRRKWMILIVTIAVIALGVLYSMYLVEPQYKSSTTLMVNSSKGLDPTDFDPSVEIRSIELSQRLVVTYIEIVKSRGVLSQVSEELGLGYSYTDMLSMVTVSQVDMTEFLKIEVIDNDPVRAQQIAERISSAFVAEVTRILKVDNVEIVDPPIIQFGAINDRSIMNIAISFVAGLMIGLFITFFMEYNNRSITTGSDVEKYMGMNLIGSIPEYTREMKRNVQV